jgi:uncharacterized protein
MAEFIITTKSTSGAPAIRLRYDTSVSSLVNADTGEPVAPQVETAKKPSAFQVSVDQPATKSSPRVLKISLGLSCNYECEYCSQRFVPRAAETNPGEVKSFVSGLDAWVTNEPDRIEFWGGEPLVYIKTMRPLAEALRVKYPNAMFSIITNGSLLTLELNEWLDTMGFSVGLSHDGPGQSVRGPDPLDSPETKAAILDLWKRLGPQRRMSFNAMLNRNNPSRAAIQRFFADLVQDPSVPIGEGAFVDAYDEGGAANSLKPEEFAAFRNLSFAEIRTGQAANFHAVRDRVTSFVNSIRVGRKSDCLSQKCGMDLPENIAVDLRGNVMTCQNVSAASVAPNGQSHNIGHVSDLANVKLNTATHWAKRSECPNCPMLHICKGSCMFLEGDLWETSCDNAFSDAVPIFAAAIEFMTGLVPMRIDGPQREDRKDLWTQQVAPARPRVIPIVAHKA